MQTHTFFRPAVAMIELIFAIVIMAVVLMSAPRLMQIAASSGYVAMQQEGIGEAASRVNMIMAYPWDENNADESFYSTILRVNKGAPDLNITASNKRIGTPARANRTFLRKDGITLAASAILGKDGAENPDDIDDFTGEAIHMHDYSGGTATSDYIEKSFDITMTATVKYLKDAVTGSYQQSDIIFDFDPSETVSALNTSNIKMIEVTLVSSSGTEELKKEITLRAFSSNVGSYELEKKVF